MRLLLEYGADVNARDKSDKTPSQYGSASGEHEIVGLQYCLTMVPSKVVSLVDSAKYLCRIRVMVHGTICPQVQGWEYRPLFSHRR